MELNDKNLEVLATGLKMPKEDLTKALTGDAELKLPSHIYTDEEYEILNKNRSDEEYFKGKTANSEMTLKEQKKRIKDTYGLETEGIKDVDSLFKLVSDSKDTHYKELLKESGSKESDKYLPLMEEKDKTITELRDKVVSTESEWEQKYNNLDLQHKDSAKKNEFMKITNSLPFEVPKHILAQGEKAKMDFIVSEKEKFNTTFLSKHELDIGENGNLIIKDSKGEIIKGRLSEPEKAETIALNFAKSNYFNLKTNEVINRDGSQKYGNLLHGMSKDDFDSKMKEEGHHPNSAQYAIYYKEFMDKN